MQNNNKKLGVVAMTTLVVGAVVGSGIFSLPQNMAEGAGAGAIIIAWVITFIGMYTLTSIFQWLSLNRSDIDDGIYGYAREGFGQYMGFNAAWGYWMSVWVGNMSYLVLIFSALGSFKLLSFFGAGNTKISVVCGLAMLWTMHFFVLRGVRSAAILNMLVTIAKILPITLFIICVILMFKVDIFKIDFWGTATLGSVTDQVKTTMLYTVYVFLGIETATVYANRAKDMITVSRATLFGFCITIVLFVCVSLLSLGIVQQSELSKMSNPSMAGVLTQAVGAWGGIFISVAMIFSIGGALLAWTLISSETIYLIARGDKHTAPSFFGTLNKNKTPANALWLTNGLISLFFIINYFSDSGYNLIIKLSSSMVLIPYLLCALFGLKLALKAKSNSMLLGLTSLGTVYGAWLIYAGGLKYLFLSAILYACGLPFYIKAKKERGEKIFTHPAEVFFAIILITLAITAIFSLYTGKLTLTD